MTCCKLGILPGPDLTREYANFVLIGAHAATNFAMSAAKTIVLAKVTAKTNVAADVQNAACATWIATVTPTSSEVAIFAAQEASKHTVTVARVEYNAVMDGNLDPIKRSAIISAGNQF